MFYPNTNAGTIGAGHPVLGRIGKILVPIDHSEASLEAAWLGVEMAKALEAALVLLHVQEKTLELFHINVPQLGALSHQDLHDLVLKYVEDPYFDTARKGINSDDIRVDFQACSGRVATVICDYAGKQEVDLIIMGSRGQSDVRELLIGSVSSDVLHRAPCPVTIVR